MIIKIWCKIVSSNKINLLLNSQMIWAVQTIKKIIKTYKITISNNNNNNYSSSSSNINNNSNKNINNNRHIIHIINFTNKYTTAKTLTM